MKIVITIHIFNGSIESYATISGLCRVKGWSESSFRKKAKTCESMVYNEYRIEITEVQDDRRSKRGVSKHVLEKSKG